jgi:prefoldin subunit 5
MAVASYLGGWFTERTWFKPPVLLGLSMATGAYAWMGATWTSDTSYPIFAVQLALLGAGFGLTVAPTTNAVVDSAPPDQRGAAASVVMVVRLLGLSVGLSALTAWGLSRFNSLRSSIELPPLTDPKFQSALLDAQEHLTAQAIAETFTAAAVVLGAGLLATFAMRRFAATGETPMEDTETTPIDAAEIDDAAADDTTPAPVLVGVGATPDLPPPAMVVDASIVSQMAALQKRTNLMLGAMGVLLAGALVAIALLFGRVADAQDNAAEAQAELATSRADLQRVEAGAALYSSQIEGFQQKLVELRPQISAGVEEAVTGLRTFGDSTLEFPVKIDQVIPIDTEVVIDRTVKVPIKTTIPINQSFDTTIKVDTPLGKIPLNVTVPVNVDVPVDLTVDVPIKETVPIKDEIPVKLDVPVKIDVSQTQLKDLTDSMAAGLESLQEMLTGLS